MRPLLHQASQAEDDRRGYNPDKAASFFAFYRHGRVSLPVITQESPMTTLPLDDVNSRQILINIGNRYVVFGTDLTLGRELAFTPENVEPLSNRVPDESEIYLDRLESSIRVAGYEVNRTVEGADLGWDFVLHDAQGRLILVVLKVLHRKPRGQEYSDWLNRLMEFRKSDSNDRMIEVWWLNTDSLSLDITRLESGHISVPFYNTYNFHPLNVWEYDRDNPPFERIRVVEELSNWLSRIDDLYIDIENWAKSDRSLRVEKVRNLTMREDLMEKFFVPEKEIPILDIYRNDIIDISVVPSGLWVIGAFGRVDIIGKEARRILLGRRDGEKLVWVVFKGPKQELVRFEPSSLSEMLVTA
jgi:hypothetical protein